MSSFVWIASYAVFLFFWIPKNAFYRLFYLPALIVPLATASIWNKNRLRLLALLSAAMCAWNFIAYIYPLSRTETNQAYAFALRRQGDWRQGSMIAYHEYHTDLWTIRYFNPQVTWVAMPALEVDRLETLRLEATRNVRLLWLEGKAADAMTTLPGGQDWLNRHVDPARAHLHITPSHNIRFYLVE
jgi:hypothetical protein